MILEAVATPDSTYVIKDTGRLFLVLLFTLCESVNNQEFILKNKINVIFIYLYHAP